MGDAPALQRWLGWRLALRDHAPGLVLCLAAGAYLLAARWPWVTALAILVPGLGALWVEARLLHRLVGTPVAPASLRLPAAEPDAARGLAWLLFAITLFVLVSGVREPSVLALLRVQVPAPELALGCFFLMVPVGWLIGQARVSLLHPDQASRQGHKPNGLPEQDGGMLVRGPWGRWSRLSPGDAVERWSRADLRWWESRAAALLGVVVFKAGIADAMLFSWASVALVLAVCAATHWLAWLPCARVIRDSTPVAVPAPRDRTLAAYGRSNNWTEALIFCAFLVAGFLLREWQPWQSWAQSALALPWRGVGAVFDAGGFGLCLGWVVALSVSPARPAGVKLFGAPQAPTAPPHG